MFSVSVEGTKQSQVEAKLLKDGKALPLKDVEIVVGEDKITFKIKKPSRDQSGVYQVKISNNQGEEVNDVNINMQGKETNKKVCFASNKHSFNHRLIVENFPSDVPSPPRDVDVNEIFQDSCVVSFKPSKDDGGTPITKYVIERLDLSLKAQWDNVGEVMPGEKCSYKVQDLVAKKEYKFRIRAVNKLGSSEPAMFGKPVLAKDPWGNVSIFFYNNYLKNEKERTKSSFYSSSSSSIDEPSKPKNVEVTDWDKDHADLKWTKPESDGGAPITGYIIEYKEKFGKEWVKGKEIEGDITEATIDGLKEGTQYEFRIRAVNKAGPGEPSDATKPIIAKCRFVKPYIVGDGLTNLIVKKGQIIKYDIKYAGEPEPEVHWFLGEKELVQDTAERITIDKYERNTVLTVRKTTRPDSGKYKLVLSNSSGTCESVGDVVVLGIPPHFSLISILFYQLIFHESLFSFPDKPSKPTGPLKVEEVRADHVKVKWEKPEDNGGTDITGYVLEKMDMDTGRWIPAGEVGPDETSFNFTGLTPKKKYKFRVKAVNKEGESEPLEVEEAILARNPYGESCYNLVPFELSFFGLLTLLSFLTRRA